MHMWQNCRMPSGAKTPPGPFSKEIAAILRAQMARKQLNQIAVAAAVGISQTQLSGILNAKKHVDVEQLDAICEAIGLRLVDVLREADDATKFRQADPTWSVEPLVD